MVVTARWRLLTVIRLCSGRLHASMWSCRSCCEKFWCICAASCASMAFPQALFRSERQEHRVLTKKHSLYLLSADHLSYLKRLFPIFDESNNWFNSQYAKVIALLNENPLREAGAYGEPKVFPFPIALAVHIARFGVILVSNYSK